MSTNTPYLTAAEGLTPEQRSVLCYIDGYLMERGTPNVRARLHAAFPFLDLLDDPEARKEG